ncbi:MAG: 2OG-Fe(II) oxygenase [Thiotrichales bacterium]
MTSMQIESQGPAKILLDPSVTAWLPEIRKQYFLQRDAVATKKTHFFDGRFENIYISREQIPAFTPVLQLATEVAQSVLGLSKPLQVGFWFNEMSPGQQTGLHSHDDGDELLSGVFYISVPDSSGELVLKGPENITTIQPVEGQLIFFDPALPHAVSKNQSADIRLSVGMNFGVTAPTNYS